MSLKAYLAKKYIQLKSWKTQEKIVVIESDDWGSERTRDKEALKQLLLIHPVIEQDRFTRLDSIATVEDLSLLFEVLTSVKDSKSNYPKLTANVCTGNPNFDKIYSAGFSEFHFEPFYETIRRRPNGEDVLDLWKSGYEQKIFIPQLHGREHVHALAWLEELRNGNENLIKAFEHSSWGIPYMRSGRQRRRNLMAALDVYGFDGEKAFQDEWIIESAAIFKSYFGYASKTFIPPAYIWHSRIFTAIKTAGIEAVQGMPLQYEPALKGGNECKKRLHINGSLSDNGIMRLARNASFEPALAPDKDWVDICLNGVRNAFYRGQPAIICSHRINFIGSLDHNNRNTNLINLKKILAELVKQFPDVIFMSSDELIERING